MDPLARTPPPPYYAVVFTSVRTDDDDGYAATAERMVELATGRPGFLGIESVRDANGVGITVSYWSDPDAIRAWHAEAEHRLAQARGRAQWYARFRLRVCRVEREYDFARDA